jgi:hypothetical protein
MTASEPGTAADPPVPAAPETVGEPAAAAVAAEAPPRRSCDAHGTAADPADERPWTCPTCLENYCRQQEEDQRQRWERHGREILRRREEGRRHWQDYYRPRNVFLRNLWRAVYPVLFFAQFVLWPVYGPVVWLLHAAFGRLPDPGEGDPTGPVRPAAGVLARGVRRLGRVLVVIPLVVFVLLRWVVYPVIVLALIVPVSLVLYAAYGLRAAYRAARRRLARSPVADASTPTVEPTTSSASSSPSPPPSRSAR